MSGEMQCDVAYFRLLLVAVVNYSRKPTLLGKNWLSPVKLYNALKEQVEKELLRQLQTRKTWGD